MTAPRQVLEGSTFLVTRRCSERRFFLRPSSVVNGIFRYVLALAARRYGVLLHACCVMSNHFHLVVTDPRGRLPEFQQYLDGLLARALNVVLGRREAFWTRDSYSAVRLETRASVVEKCAYVLANPVAAGLVRRGRSWPGVWTDPRSVGGEPQLVERPAGFFRKNGPTKAAVWLKLECPPGFASVEEFVGELEGSVREAEERARVEVEREGRTFQGAAHVLAQSPGASPGGSEPFGALKPNVACRDKWKRIEALLRLASFRAAYREALEAWRAGVRDVVFPAGTWLMRVHHAVQCAQAG